MTEQGREFVCDQTRTELAPFRRVLSYTKRLAGHWDHMTATAAKAGSNILFDNAQGQIAWQLRDDRPDVSFANHWGLFGGWQEMDESPEQTIIREIREELAFSLDVSKLQYIRRHQAGDVVAHVFLYRVTDELEGAQLSEGQRLEFLSPTDLTHRLVVPRHRDIVAWYERQKNHSA